MRLLSAEEMRVQLQEAASAIRARSDFSPEALIILGTGLGGLAYQIELAAEIGYEQIPHFPVSTVESHRGRLLLGTLAGKRVVAMQGRFHRYEGYSLQQIALPVRVASMLGARTLLVSNACGGMNPLWGPGDIMAIEDHVNLIGDNPLMGENLDEFGPRFPDMSEAYDRGLLQAAEEAALELGIPLRRGVFVAVAGPNLETRAEYRMLRHMGADVVGMSTVPEVIVARQLGMRVLGMSIITDACLPDHLMPAELDDIIRTANVAEPKLAAIFKAVLAKL